VERLAQRLEELGEWPEERLEQLGQWWMRGGVGRSLFLIPRKPCDGASDARATWRGSVALDRDQRATS